MDVQVTKPSKISNPLQMLTRYKAWANRLTYEKVAELSTEELTQERPTGFGNILHTLNHIYVVEDIFRAHLEGRAHGYSARNTETSPPLDMLWTKVQAMDQWYIDLADGLTGEELSEVIAFEFVGGGDGAMSRMEILHHIVNHATYHRGFVSDMLYQVPLKPSANDLPVFLRDVWNKT